MHTNTNTASRAILAGTAAMPALALALPAAAETDDPAFAAVRHWLAAHKAERAYHYTGDDDRDTDPTAQRLEAEFDRTYWAMAQTVPTTPEGLALLLIALAFDQSDLGAAAQIDAPETWSEIGKWNDERDTALARAAMSSSVAAELVRRAVA